MRRILQSPRRRRRLAYGVGVPLALAAIVFGVVQILPGDPEEPPERFENRPADVIKPERPVRLTPSDRARINAALDLFVRAAVKRRNPPAARKVTTPNLRKQATPAQWRRGDIPVYPYPARGTRFHDWTLNFSVEGHVNLDLILVPERGRRDVGPVTFTIDLLERRGRWLIDAFIPTQVFPPAGS
jgi:hypothetical protein